MKILLKIVTYLKNPCKVIDYFGSKGRLKFIPDRLYLKIVYRARLGKKLNLEYPKTFTEKIQWLKLYDRKPEYIKLVDKYKVRKYIRETIGKEYLIPLYGVYNRFKDIPFEDLPDQFVLKCTHDSGSLVICKEKSSFDKKAAKRRLHKCLRKNYYFTGREWPYKYVRPRIICEKLMDDGVNQVPEDYKVYCFHGEPKYIFVLHDRFKKNVKKSGTVYNMDWEIEPCIFDHHYMPNRQKQEKPNCFDEMIALCKILCRGLAQVRIDFYIVHGKCYFSEITLSTSNGFSHFVPESYDRRLGDLIQLPM